MNWQVALRLGRVSNLPTVWTNVLTGVALVGAPSFDARLPLLVLAMTLCYVAGMFLNDAFDRTIDARERPERPIPSGQVSATTVFTGGFTLLAIALVLLLWCGYGFREGTQWRPVLAGLVLVATIIFYDLYHKQNPLSPVVMGLCRVMVYLTAAYAMTTTPPTAVFLAALLLLSYLIGLTYVAKQENLDQIQHLWPLGFLALPVLYGLWATVQGDASIIIYGLFVAWLLYALSLLRRRRTGDVPRAVVSLIAGIALLDALLISTASTGLSWLAVAGFALTLLLQRYVPGT